MSRYWSKVVHGLTPYVPGEQPKTGKLVKLNTNENPFPPSPAVLSAIGEALSDSLRLYPDPNSTELRGAIASAVTGHLGDAVTGHTVRKLVRK